MPGRVVCPKCRGSGEIVIQAFAAGPSPYDRDETCPVCDGDQYVTQRQADRYRESLLPPPEWRTPPE